jgi:hypothetical protein
VLGGVAEGQLEDLMQHEGHPLGRGEPLQHHQQRQPDAVIEGDPVSGIGQLAARGRGDGLELAGIAVQLPAGPGGPDLVQAQAAGHHDQPAPLILDVAGPGADQPGERVLDGVLGRADVPEHAEREVDQVGPVVQVRLGDL